MQVHYTLHLPAQHLADEYQPSSPSRPCRCHHYCYRYHPTHTLVISTALYTGVGEVHVKLHT